MRKLFGLNAPKPPVRSGRDRDFDLKGLERILHYQFKNPDLARQAMTHRSYLHATPGRSGDSNERMEFLGDSVVGLVVNEFLYKKFTKLREGELTKMKSLLVSRVILSRAANQLGLGNYILLSDAEKGSGGRNRASILADTLEGAIGAMYLDGGIEAARQLTERLLLREVNAILSDANLANYKSMLQEYVQGEFKTHPQYRISSEYGPDHQKMFTVEVVVSGKTFGRGQGSNKKEAEQEAARDALFHFEKLVRPDVKEEGSSDARRRRRRGGRGRRNGRGGPDAPGAVASEGAGGSSAGSSGGGEGGTHRRRRSRRDGPRDGGRDGAREPREQREPREPREPRERVVRDGSRETPYDDPREGREGSRDRSREENQPIRDAEPSDGRSGGWKDGERFGEEGERSPDRFVERPRDERDERHGPPFAAAEAHE